LKPPFVLEQPAPADIPLTILRLSFRPVKGNINLEAIAPLGNVPDLTLCSKAMDGHKMRKLQTKNFVAFRF
jgi:hypothetical protein